MSATRTEFEHTVQLTEDQAMHVAEFLKRCGWTEWRACAVDDVEAYGIREGLEQVRRALRDAGFNPR